MSPRHPAGEKLGMRRKQQFERNWKSDTQTARGWRGPRPIHPRWAGRNPATRAGVTNFGPEHRGILRPSLDLVGVTGFESATPTSRIRLFCRCVTPNVS